MDPSQPYLVLGIGNCLLSDDGMGVHAAHLLQAEPPPATRVLVIETDFLSALPFLERCSMALVIDAMDAGQPPGTLYTCCSKDLARYGQRHSLHGLGLWEVLEFLEEEHRPEVHILGIQPALRGPGLYLSPEVASVLPQVARQARRLIRGFGQTVQGAQARRGGTRAISGP